MKKKYLDLEVTVKDLDSIKIINETLTRIGIPSGAKQDTPRKLYQSCHLKELDGKCYIAHFKELFGYDGKPSTITENDYARRNTIAFLLEDWGLLKVKNPEKYAESIVPMNNILIISYKDKNKWDLRPKYFGRG